MTADPRPGMAGVPDRAPTAPLNTLAVVALIASFFVSLAGIICGHIALAQIRRTNERGRGMAIAGLIVGYVAAGLTIVSVVVMLVAGAMFVSVVATAVGASTPAPAPTSVAEHEPTRAPGYSAEFCAALSTLLTANAVAEEDGTAGAPESQAVELDAYLTLSQIDSVNQDVYARAHGFLQDPSADAVGTLGSEVPAALAADTRACDLD